MLLQEFGMEEQNLWCGNYSARPLKDIFGWKRVPGTWGSLVCFACTYRVIGDKTSRVQIDFVLGTKHESHLNVVHCQGRVGANSPQGSLADARKVLVFEEDRNKVHVDILENV